MIMPNLEALARNFWTDTGLPTTFPREIEQAIALTLPLVLVKLPRLNVPEVRRWLQQRHITARLPEDARDLCGCLVAYGGRGVTFVCGADTPDEQRLTIA